MSQYEIFYNLAILSLLLFWVPIVRSSIRPHRLCYIPAVFGTLTFGYEMYIRFVVAPTAVGAMIRVDIFLISLLVLIAYALGAAGLIRSRQQGLANINFFTVLLIPLIAITGLGFQALNIGKETAALGKLLDTKNKLLFEAMFRDEETTRRYFGNLVSETKSIVGHWRLIEGRLPSRLVINDDEKAWAFYRCADTECLLGAAPLEGTRLTFTHRVIPVKHFEVKEVSSGQLILVKISEEAQPAANPPETMTFVKEAPPAYQSKGPADAIKYLGSFSHLKEHKQHITVTQLWMWQGPNGPLAVMVYNTPVKGRKAEFIIPWNLGEGRPAEKPGEYEFAPTERFKQVRAGLPVDSKVELSLENKSGKMETLILVQKEHLFDDTISLAPTVSVPRWREWFQTVFTGHFFSWNVPEVLPD
ncbi:MAG: hypothetical protein NPINA01_25820 [Nitrospinaceae bacterium]|nr:MAG: hypothetical protein NPINA01_25820 [Nitrospinaceae bacterium]